jgi:hypothetical protein
MPNALTISSKLGSLADVSDGGSFTLKGKVSVNLKSKGGITCTNGAQVNLIDLPLFKVTNGSAITALSKSKVVVSSIDTIQADGGSILDLNESDAIISDVNNLVSDLSSITSIGKSKLLLNRISTIDCKSSDAFITANASDNGGTITIKNIQSIPKTLRIVDHNLILDNVKNITSDTGAAIEFTSSPIKMGTYTLTFLTPTSLGGQNTSLKVSSSCVNAFGLSVIEEASFDNCDIITSNCTFKKKLTLLNSSYESRRDSLQKFTLTGSSAVLRNSTVSSDIDSTRSTIQSYLSSFAKTTLSAASFNIYTSKIVGDTTLTSASSITSFASSVGSVANTDSFTGVYGNSGGTLTTAGKGMTFVGGTAGQAVDDKTMTNGISALLSTFNLRAAAFDFKSTNNTLFTIGGTLTTNVTGSITQTGTSVSWTQSGSININAGANTVTITGSTVTI